MNPNPDNRSGVVAAIGGTPLVRLNRLFPDSGARFYAKLESLNPGGSAKDRAAFHMINEQVECGRLVPGKSIVVESSSGNLGIGLAQACRWFDLRLICVVDAKTTAQNIAILTAYGAEVEVVAGPASGSGDYLSSRIERVRELVGTLPDAFWPNQYENLGNARAQQNMMREVVEELGRVDYVFVATGSCGTLLGCSQYIRANGLSTRIVAVDALGSAIFGKPTCNRLIPGHGSAMRPALCRDGIADEVIHVSDQDCVVGCRTLVATEGLLCGGSSGAIVTAAGQRGRDLAEGAVCVLVLPDRGERYLDTIYSDMWVRAHLGEIEHLWKERARL